MTQEDIIKDQLAYNQRVIEQAEISKKKYKQKWYQFWKQYEPFEPNERVDEARLI